MMRKLRANVIVTVFILWLGILGYISYTAYEWANLVNKTTINTYKKYN